jgi:hypothetical protein
MRFWNVVLRMRRGVKERGGRGLFRRGFVVPGCSRECWVPLCYEVEAPLLIVKRKRLFRGDWEGIETEEEAASSQWLAAWGGHNSMSMNGRIVCDLSAVLRSQGGEGKYLGWFCTEMFVKPRLNIAASVDRVIG